MLSILSGTSLGGVLVRVLSGVEAWTGLRVLEGSGLWRLELLMERTLYWLCDDKEWRS